MVDAEARLARTVLKDNLKVRRGENVLIESWPHSLQYARAFVEETRRLGAQPTVLYEDEKAWWQSVESRRYAALGTLSEVERAAVGAADVFIYFWGPEDRPRREALPEAIQERIVGWNPEWYRRARKSGLRGCRMALGLSTDSVARVFGLDGPKWRRRMLAAGTVDAERMRAKGVRVARAFEKGKEVHLRHPNGTDLRFRLAEVRTRVDSGLLDAAAMKRPFGMLSNNPSGQVLVSFRPGDANGTFVSNRAIYFGPNKFDGIRWVFSDGHLVKHSTQVGASMFRTAYDSAPKGKDRLGYISVGLNPESRDLPPLEDTEEGATILAIGGNAFAGGKVKIPFQGFAMVGGSTVKVDGETIASNGRIR